MSIKFSDVYNKVFQIRVNTQQLGTTFRVNLKDKKLLVTAKHLFSSFSSNQNVELGEYNNSGNIIFKPIPSNCPIIAHPVADIAIIDISQHSNYLNEYFDINTNYKPDKYDEAIMLGFPTTVIISIKQYDSIYPLPLCKTTIISSLGFQNGFEVLFLDTISAPGFSGSPILIKQESKYLVIGVQVSNKTNPSRTIEPNFTELINGIYSRENTHISIATKIEYLISLI